MKEITIYFDKDFNKSTTMLVPNTLSERQIIDLVLKKHNGITYCFSGRRQLGKSYVDSLVNEMVKK